MTSKRRSLAQKKRENVSQTTTESSVGGKKPVPPPLSQTSKPQNRIAGEEFRQIFLENKRKKLGQKVSRKYTYLYSENYQNIERLLASCGRSFKARSTLPEFQVLEELNKKRIEKKKKVTPKVDEHRDPYLTRNFKNRRGK